MLKKFFSTRSSARALAALTLACAASACASKSKSTVDSNGYPIESQEIELENDLPAEDSQLQSAVIKRQAVSQKPGTGGEQSDYSGSKRPNVKTAAFETGGFLMNSFYFVRSENESYETLSKALYGRPDRASLIARWNGNRAVKPGTLMYYNSAMRPDDKAMKSFAEDFGFALEKVEVKKGDWLSKIAQERYGNAQLWKEIAAVNPDLANVDKIEVGQVLWVQPAKVDTKGALDAFIARVRDQSPPASEQITAQPTEEEQEDAVTNVDDQLEAAKAAVEQRAQREREARRPAPPAPNEEIKEVKAASSEEIPVMQLMAAGAAAVIVCALFFMRIRRRRQAAQASAYSDSPAAADDIRSA